MSSVVSLIDFILTIFPLVAAILVMVWLFQMRQNSNKQMEQNEKMITLLKEIKEGKK